MRDLIVNLRTRLFGTEPPGWNLGTGETPMVVMGDPDGYQAQPPFSVLRGFDPAVVLDVIRREVAAGEPTPIHDCIEVAA